MRISTANMFQQSVAGMLQQQSALARSQQQVASGKRMLSAGDDPVASVQVQALTLFQGQQAQYAKNANVAQDRLELEEQAMSDATTVLQRIRELTLQANNATVGASDRAAILTEIRARAGELQGIANRKDNGGDFLFSGFSAGVQPYNQDASGHIAYSGDTGQRSVMIDSSVAVPDGDPGSAVFGSVPQANGVFATAASATNTGSGVIDTGTVTNRAAWVPGTYTLSFTSPTAWQVVDASNAVVASGAYASGSAISFRGVQVGVGGAPATGDSFTVRSAGLTDMFSSLEQLTTALGSSASGDAARAQLNTSLGGALQQIDQTLDHLSGVRAGIGARLTLIDDIASSREARVADAATSASQLSDLDYASAVTRMNQLYVGLQAAQQAYVKVAGLSLFNYL